MKPSRLLFCALAVGACAGPGSLVPGQAGIDDVRRVMGEPALSWREPDGSLRLAFPHGPVGYQTQMVEIDAAGRVRRVENVLDENHFAAIRPGMTREQVLRVLGPPQPTWTQYFSARDELAWEWRYCDLWHAATRFDVLFDNTQGTVRSTLNIREVCGDDNCFC